jgi:murein endopeptidase
MKNINEKQYKIWKCLGTSILIVFVIFNIFLLSCCISEKKRSREFNKLTDKYYIRARIDHNYWWGHPYVIEFLEDLSKDLKRKGFFGVAIGDISKKDGTGIPGHKTHKNGRNVDVYFINKNKKPMGRRDNDLDKDGFPDNMYSKNYSHKYTLQLIETVLDADIKNDKVKISRVLCQDEEINRYCNKKYKKSNLFKNIKLHEDHFHIIFKVKK